MAELDGTIRHGCCEKLTILLQNGWNPNNQDGDGNTPLHYLIMNNLELFNKIMEDSANVNLENNLEQPPLHTKVSNSNTVWNGRVDSVKELLEKGANVNVQNYKGETPLHVLAQSTSMHSVPYKTQAELCRLLQSNGANVCLQDINGCTPLHLAIKLKSEITSKLLKRTSGKIAVNIPDKSGDYPVHTAIRTENLKGFKLLSYNGANLESTNKNMQTPIHFLFNNIFEMSWQFSKELIEKLIQWGADLHLKDIWGQKPLHYFAKQWFEFNQKNNRSIEEIISGCTKMNSTVALLVDWGVSIDAGGELGKRFCKLPKVFHQKQNYFIRKACLKLQRVSLDSKARIYNKYKKRCQQEVDQMKIERHGNSSLYDIFSKRVSTFYPTNQSLEPRVESTDLKVHYPIYASLLKSTYLMSVHERLGLLHYAPAVLNTPLPLEMNYYILSYVDNDSLRNVLIAGAQNIEYTLLCRLLNHRCRF